MPCIFGFNFHEWFCPCELLYTRPTHLNWVICNDCKYQLNRDYEIFLNDLKDKWDGDFDDFIAVHIDERFKHIRMTYPESCENNLTTKQLEVVDTKLGKMYDNFISSENKRLEAKIQSGKIEIEDLAAI